MRFFRHAFLLATALALPQVAHAQLFEVQKPQQPSRAFLGIGLEISQPVGEFDRYVDAGFGVGGHFVWAVDRARVFGIRVGGGFVQYGHERKRVPLSSTIGGRILVDVNTDNNIVTFGVGPQIMVPSGPVRPYVNGSAGLAYFATQSSVEGSANSEPFASTTNFDDATFAWSGGGGLYIPVRHGNRPISIDLGVQYHANGEARYLREGSIEDNPDGSISFSPIRSETNFLIYHIGVSFGI